MSGFGGNRARERAGREKVALIVAVAAACLLLVGVVLAGCGGSGSAKTVDVVIQGLQFRPAQLTIERGATVHWTNKDQTAHTITSDGFDPNKNQPDQWSSDPLNPGQTFSRTFDTPGSFPYHCDIHPYIKGTITVK